jgi:hypothetical protein
VPQALGLWWVHGVAILLGIAMLRLAALRAALWRRLQPTRRLA